MSTQQLHVYSSPLIKIEDTLPLSDGNLQSLKIWMDLCYSPSYHEEVPQLYEPYQSSSAASDVSAPRSSASRESAVASRSSLSRGSTDASPATDDSTPMVPFSSSLRVRWSIEEDLLLSNLVAEHGHDWPLIVKYFPNRTTRLVKERWLAHVQPSVVKSAWTAQEDQKLIEAVRIYGKYWTPMASMFPGRSPLMLKNRYNTKLRHRK